MLNGTSKLYFHYIILFTTYMHHDVLYQINDHHNIIYQIRAITMFSTRDAALYYCYGK